MPKFIVKIKDYYLEWSTVVDAPVTFGMDLDSFREYYQAEYGQEGMRGLDLRLERVEKQGTSSMEGSTPEDLMSYNRAGKNETCLTPDEIYRAYCLQEPVNGWLASGEPA